ncbi:MAG TPA: hypothetical protein VF601_06980 [Beijerinckiaceae bacterium]|jgi:hypothetical protein
MRRSSILDAVLVIAFMISATAVTALVRGVPEPCPKAMPSSVEGLFAPCLAMERRDLSGPADIAALYLPPPSARGGTAVAATPRDVDVTGTVAEPKR